MALDPTATWAAGLRDGKVKTANGDVYDINAVVSAEGEPQQEEIEVRGDDEIKAVFVSNVSENLTLTANAVSFDVLQAITGNEQEGAASDMEIALGTDSQENPPFVEVSARSQAKNKDGTRVDVVKTWHKVQILSVKITQAGESEVSIELTGRAFQTDVDIVDASLGSNRVATLTVTPYLEDLDEDVED